MVFAVTISKAGGPEVLTWAEVAEPVVGPGDVLIEVAASAVNRADLMQRAGFYPPPAGAPAYPGLECSGTVVEVGAGVGEWRVGDQVCALLSGGGYAQRVAVPAGQVLPRPDGVELAASAALPEVAATVWSNVFELAQLEAGETLLVHGGGSGIGTFAIQLAKARGATVWATARKEKHARIIELGADGVIDYASEDFVDVMKRATGGADVILDIMGAAYLDRNIGALAMGGRIANIGMQGGRRAELDYGALMGKRGAIYSTALRARPNAEKAAIISGVRREVWPLVADGRVRVVIDRRMRMEHAAAAHEVVEKGDNLGKVLLVTSNP